MPDLFPAGAAAVTSADASTQNRQVPFGRSWRFDFETGEFVMTPTGGVAQSRDVDAWLEWCRKSLRTPRYRYLAYGRNYGQEFGDLIARHLSRAGNEAEIRRMVTECLMVDPRTASVGKFAFDWRGDSVYFSCEVRNVRGETATLAASVVIA